MGIAILLDLRWKFESDSCLNQRVSWSVEPKGDSEKIEQIRAVLDKEDTQVVIMIGWSAKSSTNQHLVRLCIHNGFLLGNEDTGICGGLPLVLDLTHTHIRLC